MKKNDLRETLEGWIDGIFDIFEAYLRTLLLLNLQPRKAFLILSSPSSISNFGISSASVFFVISYVLMCFSLQNIDFTDPFFSIDLESRLDFLGVLDAAKTIKIDKLLLSIFPAIGILFGFTYTSLIVLRITKNSDLSSSFLRRNYSYMLGNGFFTITAVSGGYHYIVKPLLDISWWLGLPLHVLTLLPLVGMLIPIITISRKENISRLQAFGRWLGFMIPLIGFMLFMKYMSGSFYLVDYLRVK